MPKYTIPKIEIDFTPWENMINAFNLHLEKVANSMSNTYTKRSLFESYPNATHIFDIEVFNEYGPEVWAQARYLVHGFDDVYWTNSAKEAAKFLKESLKRAKKDNGS